MSKSQRSLFVSLFGIDAGLCIYHLFVWSNLNFLLTSQWITLPAQSCLVLYSFCANLLHSLIWLIVSSLSPHNLHLLFCRVLSILALIWLVIIIVIAYLLVSPKLSVLVVLSILALILLLLLSLLLTCLSVLNFDYCCKIHDWYL